MTTEGVKIVIEADYKGGDKIRKSTTDMERASKAISETGQRSKASTELVGSLANSFGNSQAGAMAGEVAQLTERLVSFNNVAGASKAGMAGLVAAAGAVSFAIGFKAAEGVDRLIQKLTGLDREMRTVQKNMHEVFGKSGSVVADALGDRLETLTGIEDLDERQEALSRFADHNQKVMERIAASRLKLANAIEDKRAERFGDPKGERKLIIERMEARLAMLDDQMSAVGGAIQSARLQQTAAWQERENNAASKREAAQALVDSRRDQRRKVRQSALTKDRQEAQKQLGELAGDLFGGAKAVAALVQSPIKKSQQEIFQPSPLQNTENRFLQTGRSLEASPVKVTAENTKKMDEKLGSVVDLLTGILEKPGSNSGIEGV